MLGAVTRTGGLMVCPDIDVESDFNNVCVRNAIEFKVDDGKHRLNRSRDNFEANSKLTKNLMRGFPPLCPRRVHPKHLPEGVIHSCCKQIGRHSHPIQFSWCPSSVSELFGFVNERASSPPLAVGCHVLDTRLPP